MPSRLWTILCKEYQDHGNTASLLHIFSVLGVDALPYRLDSFSLVTAFEGGTQEEFTFAVAFHRPDRTLYRHASRVYRLTVARSVEHVSFDFFDVVIDQFGIYTFDLYAGDTPIHVVEFHVFPIA